MHHAITTQIAQQHRAELQLQAQEARLSRQARSASSLHNRGDLRPVTQARIRITWPLPEPS
jgi:hypothetical protein